ncbi:MAG: M20/M25/M40 family metallo-hydrolase [Clostridiales bacterium]|nr:M20/M25/M40 family metallo-hydrolase [Clostridiales bacterium]
MKKKTRLLILGMVCLVLMLNAEAGQQTQQQKPEDVIKNLVLVEKTQPVPEKMKPGFDSITARDSLAMLSYIASDLMEGRETATRGYQLAAEYAASLFSLWRLKPGGDKPDMRQAAMMARRMEERPPAPAERSYLQEFVMREIADVSTSITLEVRPGAQRKTRNFTSGVDFMSMFSGAESVEAPVVFAGYGIVEKRIGWDDFKNLDVKGKIVLILSEAPGKDNPDSPFQKDKELKEKYFPPVPLSPFARRGEGFNKAREIAKLGAAAILQVQNSVTDSDMLRDMAGPRAVSDERPIINRPRRRLLLPGGGQQMPWERSAIITITREMADAVLESSGQRIDDLKKKIDTDLKPFSLELAGTRMTISTTSTSTLVRCRNVVAYIEGSDPALKDEAVVVGAHLDHLGKWGDYVFNGADDNGSGSVGVLNLARAFALNPDKPKRTVVFCLWTGEESGLLGSRYYVQNPVFPLDKTIAYVNMDMISRPYDERTLNRMARMMNIPLGDEIFKKIRVKDFLPVAFSAGAGLDEVLKSADQVVGLDLFLRETGETMQRGTGGSDHASFASFKIPWIFCITSMHDEYHQTSDSVDKVSGEMMEKVSRLVYLTTFALADR